MQHVYTWFEFCLHLFRTVERKGKVESIKVNWISPRLLSLLDYFLHKAPYWSIYNYEKRLSEGVREGFMRHVLQSHKDSREDLTGSNGESELPNWEIYADVNALWSLQKPGCHMWRLAKQTRRTVNRFRWQRPPRRRPSSG